MVLRNGEIMRLRIMVLSLALGGAASFALAQAAPEFRPGGYLAQNRLPQTAQIIPPPPAEGSPRQKIDLDIYRATRQMQGSSRWQLATADVSYTVPYLLQAFSCSSGVSITAENAPKTASLIRRALTDTGNVDRAGKAAFQRKRPYLLVEGPICVEKSDALAASYDYPSGHATLSWMSGLILTELMPERATKLMSRARAYGESRMVCGVHTMSAVEAGRSVGAVVVAAQHGSSEFRADVEAARAELEALRATGAAPDVDSCLVESTLTAKPPF
jgi:acid phosphatase (class A)